MPVAFLALVVLNHLKAIWQLAASCQLPIHKSNGINTWLPFAGCLFSLSRLKPSKIELASGCQLHRIGIWLPLACCQFIRVSELIPGCHLPVAYLTLVVLNHLKWNWHLAASCQLPIHKSNGINTWLPFAGCLFNFSRLKPSKIELASGCQLPVANS